MFLLSLCLQKWIAEISVILSSNYQSQYLIRMKEQELNDHYWNTFLNDQFTQKKPKVDSTTFSLDAAIATYAPAPKKFDEPEKVHPLIAYANQKKSKMGLQVDQIISQRNRCKNYLEIEEQEKKKRQNLAKKMGRKTTRKASQKRKDLGMPRNRRNRNNKSDSESEDREDSLQQKQTRKSGPPYLPNIIKMDDLYKKPTKDTQPQKKKKKQQKRHAGSRSRSKQDRKLKFQKKYNSSELESGPEETAEPDKCSAPSNLETERETAKKIASPLDRLAMFEKKEEAYQSNYLFQSRSAKVDNSQKNPIAVFKEEPLILPRRSDKLKVDESVSNDNLSQISQKPNQMPLDEQIYKKREQEIAQRLRLLKKREQQLKQEQKRRQMDEMIKQVERRQRELKQRQQRLKYAEQHAYKHKNNNEEYKKKSSLNKYNHQRSPRRDKYQRQQQEDWRKQLRGITGYNPHDKKYRIRDQTDIRESGFAQMNIEQAYSRKMGRREEQQEEFRTNHKTSKKRYH